MENLKEYEKILRVLAFIGLVAVIGLILSDISTNLLAGSGLVDEKYFKLVSTLITTLVGIGIYEIGRKKKLL